MTYEPHLRPVALSTVRRVLVVGQSFEGLTQFLHGYSKESKLGYLRVSQVVVVPSKDIVAGGDLEALVAASMV